MSLHRVRFVKHWIKRGGASYSPGEGAAFPFEEAQEIVGEGFAEYAMAKAIEKPPADKMVHGAPQKKTRRR